MFDTVLINEYNLKQPKELKKFLKSNNANLFGEFQTKDLNCSLLTYKIDKNGIIFEEQRRLTGKKIAYKPFSLNWKDNRSFLERVYWNIKLKKYTIQKEDKLVDEIKSIFVKSKLTNTFEISNYKEVAGRYVDVRYTVKAIHGKVASIKLNEWSIESEKEASVRKKNDENFKIKMDETIAQRNSFHSKWYYPVIKETYNPLVFFFKITVQHICNKLVAWSYRWTGV